MNSRTAIWEYLQTHHTGRERAISIRSLNERYHIGGRTLRRIVSKLRQEGFPICSDATGYYYAENQKEINTTVAWLDELVTHISNARTGLLQALIKLPSSIEIKMTVKVHIPSR